MIIELNKMIYRSVESGLYDWIGTLPRSWVKGYIKVRFWLQWSFLGLCAVLAWIPEGAFANPDPAPGSNGGVLPSYVPQAAPGLQSGDVPGTASIESLQILSDATSSFDTLWDTYLTTDSPFFGIVLYATRYIAIAGFLCWVLAAVWKWLQTGYEKFPWQMLFMPFLIAILFANGGQLTIVGLQSYKQLVYGANGFMLNSTYNGVAGKDLIKVANLREGLREAHYKELEACKSRTPDEKKACEDEVRAELEAKSQELEQDNPGVGWDIGKAVTFAFQGVIANFMTLISGTFHLIVAYALAVWASSAPLWISTSLYPAGKSPLQIFVSGLFGAALTIWLYTILQIALASQLNVDLGLHGILYPLLGGFINPLVALFAGSMGFSSVMAAGSVAGATGIKLVKALRGA